MLVPVLVDTDLGIDDALALLLALRVPGWRVEAVTVVAGDVLLPVGWLFEEALCPASR